MGNYKFTPPFVVGEKVKFIGCSKEQISWGSNDNPSMLIDNQVYIIKRVEVHSQHTKVSLEGVDGKFNSVCFASL